MIKRSFLSNTNVNLHERYPFPRRSLTVAFNANGECVVTFKAGIWTISDAVNAGSSCESM